MAKVDGDASDEQVVQELKRCLSREIEAMGRKVNADEGRGEFASAPCL